MAKPSPDIIAAFEAGYLTGAPNPYLFSSPAWDAWNVGRYCREYETGGAAADCGLARLTATRRGCALDVTHKGGEVWRYRIAYLGSGGFTVDAVNMGAEVRS